MRNYVEAGMLEQLMSPIMIFFQRISGICPIGWLYRCFISICTFIENFPILSFISDFSLGLLKTLLSRMIFPLLKFQGFEFVRYCMEFIKYYLLIRILPGAFRYSSKQFNTSLSKRPPDPSTISQNSWSKSVSSVGNFCDFERNICLRQQRVRMEMFS